MPKKNMCKLGYIGTTGYQLKLCLAKQKGYITNQAVRKSTGADGNLLGHSMAR